MPKKKVFLADVIILQFFFVCREILSPVIQVQFFKNLVHHGKEIEDKNKWVLKLIEAVAILPQEFCNIKASLKVDAQYPKYIKNLGN